MAVVFLYRLYSGFHQKIEFSGGVDPSIVFRNVHQVVFDPLNKISGLLGS